MLQHFLTVIITSVLTLVGAAPALPVFPFDIMILVFGEKPGFDRAVLTRNYSETNADLHPKKHLIHLLHFRSRKTVPRRLKLKKSIAHHVVTGNQARWKHMLHDNLNKTNDHARSMALHR